MPAEPNTRRSARLEALPRANYGEASLASCSCASRGSRRSCGASCATRVLGFVCAGHWCANQPAWPSRAKRVRTAAFGDRGAEHIAVLNVARAQPGDVLCELTGSWSLKCPRDAEFTLGLGEGEGFLDARQSTSAARAADHSCEPNCEFVVLIQPSEKVRAKRAAVLLVARKKLYGKRGGRKADELTVDYGWDASTMNERSQVMVGSPMCACMTPSCRYGLKVVATSAPSKR